MGELGMPTRVLSPALGSPFTYAIPDGREPPAAGLLTFTTMRDLYRCESTNRETAIYGVIGDPIGHSKSPLIYNAAFAEHGINAVYVPFRVPSAELLGFLDDARALGIRGLSVTIPHKEAILATATEIDPMAAAIGAANTIRFDRDSTKVWNTDCAAAVESLATALDQPADSPNFAERTCLVLGAGGAAKAIVYGLKQAGASVAIASRSRERAEELAGPWECEVVDWAARSTVRVDVLVNCTPLGMHPNVAATPMDVAYFRRGMVVFDTVYTPERTRLLQDAEAAGCKIVTGIEMFIRQARRQFDLLVGAGEWRQGTGELWRALLRPRLPTPDSRPLILIGYRGSGKSAVAACLARRLNLRAIDADVELERRAGKTIAEIFATEGEQAFRDWESRVLADVILDKASVIAAGGGVVMREENRAQLAKAGAVVWLRASVETILARVAADPTTAARRPNLTTAGGEAEVRKLLATREPLYRQCATFAIDTDTLDPDAIAAEILNRLSTLSS
jgi:shikimate dehydrogenase